MGGVEDELESLWVGDGGLYGARVRESLWVGVEDGARVRESLVREPLWRMGQELSLWLGVEDGARVRESLWVGVEDGAESLWVGVEDGARVRVSMGGCGG